MVQIILATCLSQKFRPLPPKEIPRERTTPDLGAISLHFAGWPQASSDHMTFLQQPHKILRRELAPNAALTWFPLQPFIKSSEKTLHENTASLSKMGQNKEEWELLKTLPETVTSFSEMVCDKEEREILKISETLHDSEFAQIKSSEDRSQSELSQTYLYFVLSYFLPIITLEWSNEQRMQIMLAVTLLFSFHSSSFRSGYR